MREKLTALERQAEELRLCRTEDARANEKVTDIFASHEQQRPSASLSGGRSTPLLPQRAPAAPRPASWRGGS
ncbi:unnamed protein product [Urochloa humidicola]